MSSKKTRASDKNWDSCLVAAYLGKIFSHNMIVAFDYLVSDGKMQVDVESQTKLHNSRYDMIDFI